MYILYSARWWHSINHDARHRIAWHNKSYIQDNWQQNNSQVFTHKSDMLQTVKTAKLRRTHKQSQMKMAWSKTKPTCHITLQKQNYYISMDVSHSVCFHVVLNRSLKNRTQILNIDKLSPVSNMASSGLRKMLTFIISNTGWCHSVDVSYNFVDTFLFLLYFGNPCIAFGRCYCLICVADVITTRLVL